MNRIRVMSRRMPSLILLCSQNLGKQFLTNTSTTVHQVRHMQVLEHVAYTILKEAGIPTPAFGVATTPDAAAKIAAELDTKDIVLKAQVLAGGRGMGHFKDSNVHGVVMCETPEQVRTLTNNMLGKVLVTKQTGPAGKICNSVMVTTRMFQRKEYYVAVMMERSFDGPVIIVSKQGGVNIEDVAATNPEAIFYKPINIVKGLSTKEVKDIVNKLELDEEGTKVVSLIITNLYKLFIKTDALLLEINPLALDICEEYFALDCKFSFDDSAEFRQTELFAMQDLTQLNPYEIEATKFNLSYIALDGNIGCMVNGAGLAMATMDLIRLNGGMPANFLDVGGSATTETVKEGFKIILSDPKVDVIWVNIFGGIMRCDIIAQGIIAASKDLKLSVPVVVRLQGTKVEEGKKLIQEAQLKIIFVDDFSKAAEAAVKFALMVHVANSLKLDISFKERGSASKKVD